MRQMWVKCLLIPRRPVRQKSPSKKRSQGLSFDRKEERCRDRVTGTNRKVRNKMKKNIVCPPNHPVGFGHLKFT